MDNNKKTISASELSKYVYCPYRWYYERYYGKGHLKEERDKLYKDSGFIPDSTKSKLVKGQKFHDTFFEKYKLTVRIKWLVGWLSLAAVLLIIYIVLTFL